MTEKLTDEQKAELQRQADDPRSAINRDPIERANKLIKEHMARLELKQWCIERAVQVMSVPAVQHVGNPVKDTIELTRLIFAFLHDQDPPAPPGATVTKFPG